MQHSRLCGGSQSPLKKFLQPRIGKSKTLVHHRVAQINPSMRGIPDDDAPEIGVCHLP